jgi:hypothetical protein
MNDETHSYSNAVKEHINELYPTEYKMFTEEDYKILQQNLILYKEGNPEATNYIISVFHRFVKKYADFISGEKTANNCYVEIKRDKSLNKFINLFISKEARANAKTKSEKTSLFGETCGKIRSLFSKFEYWDIYNELICALLNMANKYKITKPGDEFHKENGTFHMYVSRCFHFDAYNSLNKLIGDPLATKNVYSIDDDVMNCNDDYVGSSYTKANNIFGETMYNFATHSIILQDTDTDKIIEHMMEKADRDNMIQNATKLVFREADIDPYELEALNFNWTNGVTCSEIFQQLSSYEREILVLSYIQDKTDSEIASIYGCHRITIIKHKKIAVQKINNALKGSKTNNDV